MVGELLTRVAALVDCGAFDEADRVCRLVLAEDPLCGTAWHQLGVIAMQRGELADAAAAGRAGAGRHADWPGVGGFFADMVGGFAGD